jgi:hypothetical protein
MHLELPWVKLLSVIPPRAVQLDGTFATFRGSVGRHCAASDHNSIVTAAQKAGNQLVQSRYAAHRKILVMGLPGAGKTTLARELAPLLNAVIFNADEVREHINSELGFSIDDRITHARRMGWMCDRVVEAGGVAIADFICPTRDTRAAFGDSFVVWVDRIKEGRFADTNSLFQPPEEVDYRVTADHGPRYWAEQIARKIQPDFDPQRPTALFIGRYQPFHDGHRKLIAEGLRRVGQCCIAVRDTHGTDDNNPMGFQEVKRRIEAAMRPFSGRFVVVPLPNITQVFYGRDVGYGIERIDLDEPTKAISATAIRSQISGNTATPGRKL